MKKSHLITIIAGCISSDFAAWYIPGYDSTPTTNDNNFGIHATVVHYHTSRACPTEDCHFHEFYTKINSESNTFIEGYEICDGKSCTKK